MERAKHRPTIVGTVFIISVFAAAKAPGHHSFAAEFDGDDVGVIEAVVDEVWFRNPHVRYYVTVTKPNGEEEKWEVQTMSPTLLFREGWTKDTVKVNDRITVTGALGRDGAKKIFLYAATLPDGSTFRRRDKE